MDLGYGLFAALVCCIWDVTSDDQIPILSNPDFIPIMSIYANVSLVKWIQEVKVLVMGVIL